MLLHQPVVSVAILGVLLSWSTVACVGGDDDDESAPHPHSTTTAAPTKEQVQSEGAKDLNAEAETQATTIALVISPTGMTGHTGEAKDFTLFLTEGSTLKSVGGDTDGGGSA